MWAFKKNDLLTGTIIPQIVVVVVGGDPEAGGESWFTPSFEQASPSAGLNWQTAGTKPLRWHWRESCCTFWPLTWLWSCVWAEWDWPRAVRIAKWNQSWFEVLTYLSQHHPLGSLTLSVFLLKLSEKCYLGLFVVLYCWMKSFWRQSVFPVLQTLTKISRFLQVSAIHLCARKHLKI